MIYAMPGEKAIYTPFATYLFRVDNKRSRNLLTIHVNEEIKEFDIKEVKQVVDRLPFIKRIQIMGIKNQILLNDCFTKINLIDKETEITVSEVEDIKENSLVEIDYLTKRQKLVFDLTSQCDFTTWAHRLNEKDKKVFKRLLSSKDLFEFNKEEEVVKYLCAEIERKYPNIHRLAKKEQFELIFEYIKNKYPYYFESLRPDGHATKPGFEWTHTAYGTYFYGTGVCEGRSRLIKLIANSNYFKLPCYTVSGSAPSGVGHCWNQFIDNETVLNYDSSFSIKGLTKRELKKLGYIIEREDGPVSFINKIIHF